MMHRFSQKIVVVTGGAWGIGKNISKAFAREGATVIICSHTKEHSDITLEEMKAEGLTAYHLSVDLQQNGAATKMIQRIIKKWGSIDVLINNAKYSKRVGLLDETEESWGETMMVSVQAAFFASQEAVRHMKKMGGGSILNISSVEGERIGFDSPSYHAAKAAMIQMTKYVAVHAGSSIRTNCLLPGMIIKDEFKSRYDREDNSSYRRTVEYVHPLGIAGTSNDVAQAALFLCSKEASFINGASLVVDGGLIIQEPCGMFVNYKTHS